MNRISDFLANKLPFFYGYLILLVAIAAQFGSSPGQTYAISVFSPHLEAGLGLSKSALSAAYMLGTLLAALPLTLIGPLSDRIGIRGTVIGVAAGLVSACMAASQVQGFFSVLLVFLLLRFLGQGAMTLLAGNMVSMWFHRRLGTMNAIMCAGSATAFAIVPVVLQSYIEGAGWRAAFVAQGVVLGLLLLPALVLIYRNNPQEVRQHFDGDQAESGSLPDHESSASSDAAESSALFLDERTLGEAIRNRTFWILAADMCFWAMIGTGLVFHSQAIFAQFGVTPTQTQAMFPIFSASMLVAQLAGGPLADRVPMHYLLGVAFFVLAIGAASIPIAAGVAAVYLFAVLFGAGQGLAISVTATMWARYYGRRHLGKIRGAVWCLTVAGSGCGPLILGSISDATGSFVVGLWIFTGLLIPLAPLSLLATPLPKR
ncbi:MAG: MFS transporter [Aureliella sp.]